VQALTADPNTKLIALADTFRDQLDSSLVNLKKSPVGDRVDVDEGHKFTGFDAYKGVIETCDVVLLATTPAFRPAHLRAAVEAGKHVFCEKPIAVDGPGLRSVLDTTKLAKDKNVNIVSGLCYRYQFAKRDTIKRIQDGALGEIIAMQTTYNTGSLWHKGNDPKWSETEYQVRNWLYFDWLSGDHINEQHIHSLDKIAWAMGDVYPAKATASGGRTVRTEAMYGNIYDHFNTVYEWENGVRCFSSCRQWGGAATDVSDFIFGTKGKSNIQDHWIDAGGSRWDHKPEGPDDMYQNEHNELFAAIRDGRTINNGEYMCNSTLMAIMGRVSAYSGQTVTRDQVLNSKLSLVPEKLEWSSHPANPIAVPGQGTHV
jgi:predicted dehydrogenase